MTIVVLTVGVGDIAQQIVSKNQRTATRKVVMIVGITDLVPLAIARSS